MYSVYTDDREHRVKIGCRIASDKKLFLSRVGKTHPLMAGNVACAWFIFCPRGEGIITFGTHRTSYADARGIIYTLWLWYGSDIIFHSIISPNLFDDLLERAIYLGNYPLFLFSFSLSLPLFSLTLFDVLAVLIEMGLLCCKHAPWNALINVYFVNKATIHPLIEKKNLYVSNCEQIKLPLLTDT